MVKQVGSVVIRGVVSEEKALGWKSSILDYSAANGDNVTGYPADDIQVIIILFVWSMLEAEEG